MNEWTPMKIVSQDVEVRCVTDPEGEEIVKYDGFTRRVRHGDYIVRTADGKMWSCNSATLAQCYRARDISDTR